MLLQEEIQANVKPTTNIQDAPISSSRKKKSLHKENKSCRRPLEKTKIYTVYIISIGTSDKKPKHNLSLPFVLTTYAGVS